MTEIEFLVWLLVGSIVGSVIGCCAAEIESRNARRDYCLD